LLQKNLSPFAGKLLQHAGTGNKALALHDKAVRSDMIYWLDRSHNNAHENAFFDLMDKFVATLTLPATPVLPVTSFTTRYMRKAVSTKSTLTSLRIPAAGSLP